MSDIIFISKDALNKHALPIYGNTFWRTPNIDALAKKGTVFNRHYTAGGSTAMAFTAMAIGNYCYTTGRKSYKNEQSMNGNTLFDKLYSSGYDCHIIWDDTYTSFAQSHFKCEGLHTRIHSLHGLKQRESKHIKGIFDDVSFDNEETAIAVRLIKEELTLIKDQRTKDVFVWMHLPHVMRGRQGYGSDIDVFDDIIGIARDLFGDDAIFVSADHGHMNGWKGKYHYGFDVGEEVACIPLIGPRVNDSATIDFPTSTIQMLSILKDHRVEPLEYVLCETAYYAQPKRKICIIKGDYKYCFDKEGSREFLYDLSFDKEENHNLVFPEFYDTDRLLWYSTAQCFYYPRWEEAKSALTELRGIKKTIWRNGGAFEEFFNRFLHRLKCVYTSFRLKHPKEELENTGK